MCLSWCEDIAAENLDLIQHAHNYAHNYISIVMSIHLEQARTKTVILRKALEFNVKDGVIMYIRKDGKKACRMIQTCISFITISVRSIILLKSWSEKKILKDCHRCYFRTWNKMNSGTYN